jgi:integrase
MMRVYKRGETWWYHFIYAGRSIQESAKTHSKTVAKRAEQNRRRELEEGFSGISRQRKDRVRTLADLSSAYFKEYQLKHRAATFAEYAIRHLCDQLGSKMLIEVDASAVSEYQTNRLKEKAAPKSINDEVGILLRIMGDRGDLLRSELKRRKILKLKVGDQPGKAFDVVEKDRMLLAAEKSRSPLILPALTLALNAGMRDAEIKTTRWSQIDFSKLILTVGRGKTTAGEGRTIPLNSEILPALMKHAKWYAKKFGELRPEWYVFPFGRRGHMDPSRPVTTLKTAWTGVRKNANVQGCWHDARHTLITELAESGAGDETIMAIAGHVSRQMLTRYSHIRTEAKRSALEDVVARRQKVRALHKAAAEKEVAEAASVTVN